MPGTQLKKLKFVENYNKKAITQLQAMLTESDVVKISPTLTLSKFC